MAFVYMEMWIWNAVQQTVTTYKMVREELALSVAENKFKKFYSEHLRPLNKYEKLRLSVTQPDLSHIEFTELGWLTPACPIIPGLRFTQQVYTALWLL